MNIKYCLQLLLLFTMISGCAGRVPFQEPQLTPIEIEDTENFLKEYAKRIPQNFQLLNSVTFYYNWYKKMTALGYLKINDPERRFLVLCLNPLGLKIFEISGDKDSVKTHFALKQLVKQGDFAPFVADDIRRIYFDLIPHRYTKVERDKNKIIFHVPSERGHFQYVFGGAEKYLIEKHYYENHDLIWSVLYYEYTLKDGKIHPGGIILVNKQYSYRLVVKLKSIRLSKKDNARWNNLPGRYRDEDNLRGFLSMTCIHTI